MRFLDKLERRIGWLAIRNLAILLVVGNAAAWVFGNLVPDSQVPFWLALIPPYVLQGQVWRVVSFVFLNSFRSSIIFIFLELYFLYMIGSNLEANWGSFKFTVYYLSGLLLTAGVALLTGVSLFDARHLHLSLFFAFAQLMPEMRIMLFFIIPVKVKWLAWASWAFTGFEFVTAGSWSYRFIILAPIAIFLAFFWRDILYYIRNRRRASTGRQTFHRKIREAKIVRPSFHKCETCGRTELDSPDIEFRFCSRCEGDYEYCSEHIRDHVHRSQH